MSQTIVDRPAAGKAPRTQEPVRPHTRLDWSHAAPDALRAMLGLEASVRRSGLEQSLLQLVRMRASQLDHCAYCIDMHSKDARHEGESEQRLYALSAWRETPFFTPRERAALAWTEAVTDIVRTGVPDDAYDEARAEFDEAELVALTMAIVTINGWNRLAVGFRVPVGDYVPGATKHLAALQTPAA